MGSNFIRVHAEFERKCREVQDRFNKQFGVNLSYPQITKIIAKDVNTGMFGVEQKVEPKKVKKKEYEDIFR